MIYLGKCNGLINYVDPVNGVGVVRLEKNRRIQIRFDYDKTDFGTMLRLDENDLVKIRVYEVTSGGLYAAIESIIEKSIDVKFKRVI